MNTPYPSNPKLPPFPTPTPTDPNSLAGQLDGLPFGNGRRNPPLIALLVKRLQADRAADKMKFQGFIKEP
jgi:hypothetical protein